MDKKLHRKPKLVPLDKVTHADLPRLRIGEDFFDLSRLGMIGEYEEVPATDDCPRLYYRWNHRDGYWEIYATEHDLIGYNLGSVTDLDKRVDKIEEVVLPTEAPTETPTEIPTQVPTDPVEPDYVHSTISRDPDLTGGDLEVIIDGGLMILGGNIKYYCENRRFMVPGNYVGCMITPDPIMWSMYRSTVKVEYKGRVFGSEAFTRDGKLILYPMIKVPGQEVPITVTWNDEFIESFVVAITQESNLCKC